MRKKLQSKEGERRTFIGTFSRTGKKTNYLGYSEDTILLTNVIDIANNEQVTDHIWFSFTKGFEKFTLREGDQIQFDARVKQYEKGYVNRKLKLNHKTSDFRLSHPTKIKKLGNS